MSERSNTDVIREVIYREYADRPDRHTRLSLTVSLYLATVGFTLAVWLIVAVILPRLL